MEDLKQKVVDYLSNIDLKDKDIVFVKTYAETVEILNRVSSTDYYATLLKSLSENRCCSTAQTVGFGSKSNEEEKSL